MTVLADDAEVRHPAQPEPRSAKVAVLDPDSSNGWPARHLGQEEPTLALDPRVFARFAERRIRILGALVHAHEYATAAGLRICVPSSCVGP